MSIPMSMLTRDNWRVSMSMSISFFPQCQCQWFWSMSMSMFLINDNLNPSPINNGHFLADPLPLNTSAIILILPNPILPLPYSLSFSLVSIPEWHTFHSRYTPGVEYTLYIPFHGVECMQQHALHSMEWVCQDTLQTHSSVWIFPL